MTSLKNQSVTWVPLRYQNYHPLVYAFFLQLISSINNLWLDPQNQLFHQKVASSNKKWSHSTSIMWEKYKHLPSALYYRCEFGKDHGLPKLKTSWSNLGFKNIWPFKSMNVPKGSSAGYRNDSTIHFTNIYPISCVWEVLEVHLLDVWAWNRCAIKDTSTILVQLSIFEMLCSISKNLFSTAVHDQSRVENNFDVDWAFVNVKLSWKLCNVDSSSTVCTL